MSASAFPRIIKDTDDIYSQRAEGEEEDESGEGLGSR